jgi:Kef-type K+ transport system membrane component KefB
MLKLAVPALGDLAWPMVLAVAWVAGEFGHRWLRLPRISIYGIVGFVLSGNQGGLLADADASPIVLLADVAFGLILFELGYRINMDWIRANPWLGLTSLVEAVAAFAAVFFAAK